MNVFDDDLGAGGYDAARPYVHAALVSRVAPLLATRDIRRALDVACGTGQSSEALLSLAGSVVALDASAAMLRYRRPGAAVRYVRAVAEHLPFRESSFDLLSVGLAVHWFDQQAFVADAARVLIPGGWLLVYDSGFCSRVIGNPAFSGWLEQYRERFPSAPRRAPQPSLELLAGTGFVERKHEVFVHAESWTVERLARYVASQSSVLYAVHEGRDSHESALSWLRESLSPLFGSDTARVEFDGWLHLYQRS